MDTERKFIDLDTPIHAGLPDPLLPLPLVKVTTERDFLAITGTENTPFDSVMWKSFHLDDPFDAALAKANTFSENFDRKGGKHFDKSLNKSFKLSPAASAPKCGKKRCASFAALSPLSPLSPAREARGTGGESGASLKVDEPSPKRQRMWRSFSGASHNVDVDWRPHVLKKMISSRIDKCIEQARRLAKTHQGAGLRCALSVPALPPLRLSSGSSGSDSSYGLHNVAFLAASPGSGSSGYPSFREGIRSPMPGKHKQVAVENPSKISTLKRSQNNSTDRFMKLAYGAPTIDDFLLADGCEVDLVPSEWDTSPAPAKEDSGPSAIEDFLLADGSEVDLVHSEWNTSPAPAKEDSSPSESIKIPKRKSLPAKWRDFPTLKTSTPVSSPVDNDRSLF